MIPLLSRLWYALRYDELAVRRWGRSILMAIAGGGIAFADQIAAVVEAPGAVQTIKVVAVVAGFLSLMVNAGERNPRIPAVSQSAPPAQPSFTIAPVDQDAVAAEVLAKFPPPEGDAR